jgi:hypothetical protein
MLKQLGHNLITMRPEEYALWIMAANTMVSKEIARLDATGVPASAIAADIRRLAEVLPG